ncbi:MAG: sorbitol dehydrogenase family protein [Gammaproteobacteria bacterium]|nr:sorbitol dehydrogenase family protein [Gammaproteobacteria bacterium]
MSEFTTSLIEKKTISRRRSLRYIAGFAACLLIPTGLKTSADSPQKAEPTLDQFMKVSLFLTGKKTLNPKIGQRLYQILTKKSGFSTGLLQLQSLTQSNPETWNIVQREAAIDILSAWYLGKVGQGATAQVVSYEKALMFDAVTGVLGIRSYCSGRPGYWSAKPVASA